MVGQVNCNPVEAVRDRRAGRTPRRVLGPKHEMIDKNLRASSEEISQRRFSFVGLEAVLLVDPHPGQLLPFSRQLIAPPSKILLGLEQFYPDRNPFLSRYDLVFRLRCLCAHVFLSLFSQLLTI